MNEIDTEFQAAVSTARHALEQFNAEPLVESKRGGPRLSPWWWVWVQASEVAQRWYRQRDPQPPPSLDEDYSATVKAYKRALQSPGLREVKFHGLRHCFGTIAVQAFPLSDVQAWMGHADIQTTMRYGHYVPKQDAAQRLGRL